MLIQIRYEPGRSNALADTLSRPSTETEDKPRALCFLTLDIPHATPTKLREKQLHYPELKKIIGCLEKGSPEETSQWTSRGYLTNQGVLYRYSPTDDVEEAQLVVPTEERLNILKQYHDAPQAGHYGVKRTINKILQHYYWTGLRKTVADYVRQCSTCQRYKPTNQVPAGLLQTPVMRQRFEVVAIDLFGPLPEGHNGHRWVFILEDTTTRWTELYALVTATAEECAWNFVDQFCLRYGTPRRIISDNGPQFVSAVMQCVTHCLGIDQSFTPVYHPAANPVERRNRDLKTQLAILVGSHHSDWPRHLPAIRFALNTTRCQSTGYTPAYLTFGQELRHPLGVTHDFRSVVNRESFIQEVTPRLLAMANTLENARETWEREQDRQKRYVDSHRRAGTKFQPGDYVWITNHALSNRPKQYSRKLAPRRDGPYIILKKVGPCSYQVANPDQPTTSLGVYHVSALTPYQTSESSAPAVEAPVRPVRKRGRPRKNPAPES